MSESGARPLRIVLPGGSGQVGRMLARVFQERGHHVTVLTRGPYTAPWLTVHWDGKTLGPWVETLEGADVCIHLSGRSIDCRYTARNRRELYDSRIGPTHLLHEAFACLANPPRLWMNASTATIYRHSLDKADGRGDRRDRRQRADLAPPPRSGEMELDGRSSRRTGRMHFFRRQRRARARLLCAPRSSSAPRGAVSLQFSRISSAPGSAASRAMDGRWFPGCTRPITPALSSF